MSPDPRLVMRVTTGRLAGLHVIDGTVSQLELNGRPLPRYIPSVNTPDQREVRVEHFKQTPRYVLYLEV